MVLLNAGGSNEEELREEIKKKSTMVDAKDEIKYNPSVSALPGLGGDVFPVKAKGQSRGKPAVKPTPKVAVAVTASPVSTTTVSTPVSKTPQQQQQQQQQQQGKPKPKPVDVSPPPKLETKLVELLGEEDEVLLSSEQPIEQNNLPDEELKLMETVEEEEQLQQLQQQQEEEKEQNENDTKNESKNTDLQQQQQQEKQAQLTLAAATAATPPPPTIIDLPTIDNKTLQRILKPRAYPLFLAEKAALIIEEISEAIFDTLDDVSSNTNDSSAGTVSSRSSDSSDSGSSSYQYQQRKQQNLEKEKIVILGTGWGSAAFLKSIDMDMYDVTVISPRNFFLFTPM